MSENNSVSVCPSCGYCPHCGRGGHQVAPWVVPMPYYPQPYQTWWGPTWTGHPTTLPSFPTYTVTCGTLASGGNS